MLTLPTEGRFLKLTGFNEKSFIIIILLKIVLAISKMIAQDVIKLRKAEITTPNHIKICFHHENVCYQLKKGEPESTLALVNVFRLGSEKTARVKFSEVFNSGGGDGFFGPNICTSRECLIKLPLYDELLHRIEKSFMLCNVSKGLKRRF